MGTPTVTQRIDQLEEKAIDIEATMAEMVTKAVETAVNSMKQSLAELLVEGQATAPRKQEEEWEALAARLGGRVNRFREQQAQMVNTIRTDQLKWCSEMRSTMTELQAKNIRSGDEA